MITLIAVNKLNQPIRFNDLVEAQNFFRTNRDYDSTFIEFEITFPEEFVEDKKLTHLVPMEYVTEKCLAESDDCILLQYNSQSIKFKGWVDILKGDLLFTLKHLLNDMLDEEVSPSSFFHYAHLFVMLCLNNVTEQLELNINPQQSNAGD